MISMLNNILEQQHNQTVAFSTSVNILSIEALLVYHHTFVYRD